METAAKPSTLGSILRQRCPRCRMGRIFRYSIFRGFPKMCERCSICDLRFEREPGYFLGSMYISYFLGVLIMAPIAALLMGPNRLGDHQSHHRGGPVVLPARANDHALRARTLDLS